MSETIGLVSGLLTLTIFAYNGSKSLYEAISSFKSQRKTITELQTDLSSLVDVLGLIREQVQRTQNEAQMSALRQPLECCATTCQEIHRMLDACTKHAKTDRDSIRDWLAMQYRGKSFDDMKQRLASYKSTLSIMFTAINIEDHAISKDVLDELKNSIEGTKEDLEDQLDRVQDTITTTVETALQDTLRTDQARLQNSLDSLAQAQRTADLTQPQVVVARNSGGERSRALYGTDTAQPRFNLNVLDNQAGRDAVMGAGVFSPQAIHTLLGRPRTAEVALMVQALQDQPSNTNSSTLRTILNHISDGHTQEPTGGVSPVHISTSFHQEEEH